MSSPLALVLTVLVILLVLASLLEGWEGSARYVTSGWSTCSAACSAPPTWRPRSSPRTLGAGGAVAATIAGRLAVALVVDQFGLLGVAQRSVTPLRIARVLLLAAGTVLVVRG